MPYQDKQGNWVANDSTNHDSYMSAADHERTERELRSESWRLSNESSASREESLRRSGVSKGDAVIIGILGVPGLILLFTGKDYKVKLIGFVILVLLGFFIWIASKFSKTTKDGFYALIGVAAAGCYVFYQIKR